MKLLNNTLITIILLTFYVSTQAQNPSFYKLGEEELSGVKIYDLIQDDRHNYWLATDQGLIKYDGYSFTNINNPSSLSNSIFDLRMDYNGNVFFKNFSGQFFTITNDSCSLYFQIPDSLMFTEIYYEFNNNNELVIASSSLFKVDNNKNIQLLTNHKLTSSYGEFHRHKDNSLVIQRINSNELIEIKNNNVSITQIEKELKEAYYISSFYLNNKLYYYGRGNQSILTKKGNRFLKDTTHKLINTQDFFNYYSDNELLSVTINGGGIRFFDKDLNSLFKNKTLFKNSIISCKYKDNKGNN